MALHMAQEFTQAIKEGLTAEGVTSPSPSEFTLGNERSSRGEAFDYNTPDAKMFQALEKSVYMFSAAKSYHINEALTELLRDGDHQASFSKFNAAAKEKLGIYSQYAKVEYNAAVGAAQMSAKWGRFEENADAMPYLQFNTSKGEHVCPICSGFDDMIARIDAPVWKYASPLLHFGCNCTLTQLPDSSYTPTPADKIPDEEVVPPLFRTDYTRKSQAFPPGHPYYKGVPKKSLTAWARENLKKNE